MSQTTRVPSEFFEPTQTFELGANSHVRTQAKSCPVFVFSTFQPRPAIPEKGLSIEAFVDRWATDPVRRGALATARGRLARKTGRQDEISLRALRLRAGLSQSDVARAISTSQSHIARIEGGTLEPTMDTCRRLARVLDVDLNTIDQALQSQLGAA